MSSSLKKQTILALLKAHLPDVKPTLVFNSPFELMVAVILSAQCTDVRVNQVTAPLFKKYSTPRHFADLSPAQLAEHIKSCGLYRNKSKHIVEASKMLIQHHRGQVPNNLADLMALPGVGRKTANVILSQAYGQPTMPVDTHVFRVSRRIGLTQGRTTVQVEKDLLALIPPDERNIWHLRLIHFGRTVCLAKKPRCLNCVVLEYCQYAPHEENKQKEK